MEERSSSPHPVVVAEPDADQQYTGGKGCLPWSARTGLSTSRPELTDTNISSHDGRIKGKAAPVRSSAAACRSWGRVSRGGRTGRLRRQPSNVRALSPLAWPEAADDGSTGRQLRA